MKVVWNIFGKIILIILLVTVVVPVGYLAWRADQPMDLPQFKGLTYYQYLKWREASYYKLAVAYQAAYPNAKMGEGLDACFDVDTVGDLSLKLPLAGFYTLAGAFPNLGKFVTPPDRQYIPKHVTLMTFLPDWWQIYEAFVWDSAQHAPYGPVVYCRLQPNIPTSVSLDP